MKRELKWFVGYSQTPETAPQRWVKASVPGAVQLDWARAEGWDDYTYGDNWKDYLWMEDVYWSYICELNPPNIGEGERLFFVCKGVDYHFQVKLNGELLYEQEGMFTPFELDLTDRARQNDLLEVQLFPAPKREGAEADRTQADQSCKPAVSYGWDWHPRLIPLGIWEDTYLEVRPACHIQDAEVSYKLNKNLDKAEVTLDLRLSQTGDCKVSWKLYDQTGNLIFTEERDADEDKIQMTGEVQKPDLWWPNGQGEPVLYNSQVELVDNQGIVKDKRKSRIGFRTVRLVMHPGAWDEPKQFPKTRSNPPITLEVNGRRIFCKGSNWVNPEIFPGIINEDTYRPLVEMAKEAHMNLFRSWGGGIINKESFFDLCDEMGIMVWQEFPLSCNNYRGTPEYLRVLDQESRSIIKRLRPHASVVMWCGGNELFNGWSGMTDQSLALRLLNRNCYDLDPSRPFIMTSPLMGIGHGNYLFRYQTGEEVFQVMPKAANTAYTEFGCPGPSPADYLRDFIPEDDLFPPKRGTAWESHHAFGAWGGSSNTWLLPEVIEHYFGPHNTLEEMVERGQLLQSEGYKCIFEEARRQKPRCSMALNWCYNEPWPTAANNSLINWPNRPKACYYAVAASLRPMVASARISKFSWKEGDQFDPELWILNDAPESVPGGRIEAYLRMGEEELPLLVWDYPSLNPNTNLAGPVIRFTLPGRNVSRIVLVLRAVDHPEMDSEYTLVYQAGKTADRPLGTRIMNT